VGGSDKSRLTSTILQAAPPVTFTFHKVVRKHYSVEVGEFTICLCEIFSGYCTPKIIEIDSVFNVLFKI